MMHTASKAPSSSSEMTFEALVGAAAAMVDGADPKDACRTTREITESHPEQPGAWYLYGMATLKSGDPAAAIPLMERAIALRRANPLYYRVLAQACRGAGQLSEAGDALEHALRLEPNDPRTLLSLGVVWIAQGHRDAGVTLCKRGFAGGGKLLRRHALRRLARLVAPVLGIARFAADPSCGLSAWSALEYGRMLESLEYREKAMEQYQAVHARAPEHARTLERIGRLLSRLEQNNAAVPYLEQAAAIRDGDRALQTDFGIALLEVRRTNDAIEVLESVLSTGSPSVRAMLALGRARTIAGDFVSARAVFEEACALDPQSADARTALGRCRQEEGDMAGANADFTAALDIDPAHAKSFRFLASNEALSPDNFDRLLDLLESSTLSRDDRIPLHYAAAMEFERAGKSDAAFEHYGMGNDLRDVIFDPDHHAKFIDRIIDAFDRDHFSRTEDWGDPVASPIFILGMPRSGTSLTEQILASHRDVFGAGELDLFQDLADGFKTHTGGKGGYPECIRELDRAAVEAMTADHQRTLRGLAGGAPRVSDKMPNNYLHIGLILTLYPNARILHCRRDPRDTCFSIYGLDFFANHPYAYDQVNLGRYYRQYERLMDHWRRIAPGRIMDVVYEDLVADQETITRKMLEFCDLDWDQDCLDFHKTERNVRTWSYRQVRQPIYKTSVARWRKFAGHLKPLLAELDIAGE